jgi:tellurite resistance protein TehA-like permease
MTNLILIAQIIVAASVYYVWIFRYFNVIKEFNQFELSDLTRSFVGAAKISLATLLVVGIWYSEFIVIPAALMGLFMIGAQYFHFKANSPLIKRLPSLILLILCAYLIIVSIETI